jgi:hypothetical protein
LLGDYRRWKTFKANFAEPDHTGKVPAHLLHLGPLKPLTQQQL